MFGNDLSASVDSASRPKHITGSTDAMTKHHHVKPASVIQLMAYWLSKQESAVQLRLTAQGQFQ